MKVLKVIHGFPPDYMAGSEVYSYHLVKELIRQGIETYVFTRVENEFDEEYKIYRENYDNIPVFRVNKPKRDYLFTDKYYDDKIDRIFEDYLLEIKPDLVHIGHLSHLSTKLVQIVKEHNIPVVYTIHDFWLYCVKGQLINKQGNRCNGPSSEKCTVCSPYVVDVPEVESSLKHMKNVINSIDMFVSPSITLKDFFINQGIDGEKIKYLKYGFDTEKIKFNRKVFEKDSRVIFGFMGRIIPTKGIKVLMDVFQNDPEAVLYIYGNVGSQKRFLKKENIFFKGGYDNNNINHVLSEFDVLIVPSVWLENAPLVIQEAFLAGMPVITSDIGGMAELVSDGINGYTFKTGDAQDLTRVIKKIVADPEILNGLQQCRESVVDIKDDAGEIIKIYKELK